MTARAPGDDSLENIAAEVAGCPLCKLARTRKNAVPGEGLLAAKIMFVGEAPGRSEDQTGRPFVGPAGKILDQLLEKADIERSRVFITNVVKCRPPNNRLPDKDEVMTCRSYLDRQLSLVRPLVICILGRTAYSSLLGGSSITADRGKIVEKAGQKYFLTLHPAAGIYNKRLLSTLEADLKKLAKAVKEMEKRSMSTTLENYA
jgi:DNA polymerase